MFRKPLANQAGIGLIAAIFIVVVVAMFGVLIARYTMISSQSSAEDYLWAQALYAAESAAQLRILHADGGGGGWTWADPTINTMATTVSWTTLVGGATTIYQIRARAGRATVDRVIEVTFRL